jgi:hypothetical protein
MNKPLDDMTNEEFDEYLRNKPPPSQEFLDWERDMMEKQVAAGQITQKAMDDWLALREKNHGKK